ncbi:unnamed protein product [Calicophoron daubneyi]|uniref:Uncharacterized protein n=1 Tax=Calicophoron daubneyi TaxID=300641 RepID=A0AAV2TL29_CALDB
MRFTANLTLVFLLTAVQESSNERSPHNSIDEYMEKHRSFLSARHEGLKKFFLKAKDAWNILKPRLNKTAEIFFRRVTSLSEDVGQDYPVVNGIIDEAERFTAMVLTALDSYFGEIKSDEQKPDNISATQEFSGSPKGNTPQEKFDHIANRLWSQLSGDINESMADFSQLMAPLMKENSIVVTAAFKYTEILIRRFLEGLQSMADHKKEDYSKIDRSKLEEPDYEFYAQSVRGLLNSHVQYVNETVDGLTKENEAMNTQLKNTLDSDLRTKALELLRNLWENVDLRSTSDADYLRSKAEELKTEGEDYSPIVDLTVSLVNVQHMYFRANTFEKGNSTMGHLSEIPDNFTKKEVLESLLSFHNDNFNSTMEVMRIDAAQLSKAIFTEEI